MLHTVKKQPLQVFYKKCVLRNFAKLTGKLLCQSLFFIKLQVCDFCEISNSAFFTGHLRTPPGDCSIRLMRLKNNFKGELHPDYIFLYFALIGLEWDSIFTKMNFSSKTHISTPFAQYIYIYIVVVVMMRKVLNIK